MTNLRCSIYKHNQVSLRHRNETLPSGAGATNLRILHMVKYVRERQIPYDFICTWNLKLIQMNLYIKQKIHKHRKQTNGLPRGNH